MFNQLFIKPCTNKVLKNTVVVQRYDSKVLEMILANVCLTAEFSQIIHQESLKFRCPQTIKFLFLTLSLREEISD